MAATSNGQKPATKTEVLNALSEKTGISKKQVGALFEALEELIGEELGNTGPGVMSIPGLMKITVQHKPAQPEREGLHPITKQPTVFKAKPARNVVKCRPLKKLKDLVA